MKTVVVYYSMSGHAESAARAAAERTGAELLRLEPEKPYPDKGFAKFFWGGKSAVMSERHALKPYEFDAAGCGRVVFVFPVWAGTFAPPVRSFIEDNKAALAGKRFAAVACQSGSGAEKAFKKLETALGAELEAQAVLVDTQSEAEKDKALSGFCAALAG